MGAKSVSYVAENALIFGCVCAYVGEDERPKFQDAIHECDRSIVRGIVKVCFIGFVYEFGCAHTPLLGYIAVFDHEFE